MIDCLDRRIVKIRKKRQCFGCLRHFEKGQELERASYADEGTVYSLYTCQTCLKALEFLATHDRIDHDDYIEEGWLAEFESSDRSYEAPKRTPEEYLEYLLNNNEAKKNIDG